MPTDTKSTTVQKLEGAPARARFDGWESVITKGSIAISVWHHTSALADLVAERLADALNAAVCHPWAAGPTAEDVGGRPFLGYFEGDDWRELRRVGDGRICFADGDPVRTPPTFWKPMPPAPERG